jgi:hypothetical protein
MAGSEIVIKVMQWLREVEPRLTTGHRALLRVRIIPQLRLLNKNCFEHWTTDIDVRVSYLVAMCVKDGCSPVIHNKHIGGLDATHVELVKCMLRLQRSKYVIPQANARADLAVTGHDRSGSVAWVSTGLVDYFHRQFQSDAWKHPNQRNRLGLRRSTSVPRVHDFKRYKKPHRRTKSLSPQCGYRIA